MSGAEDITGSLDALFRPRSLAIVGASGDANKVGGRPLAFLKKAGYAGRMFPVNPGAEQVQGVPSFKSLEAIGQPIDQAIIAVPAAQVLAVAERCMALGVKALQIFSAGFGEGANAARDQQMLVAAARAAGVRILGPNSLGLFNTADNFFGTFATALDGAWPKAGGVGVATQSGAFGSYFFGMAQQRGLGFSHFVATGNEGDVDVADCIRFMVRDPATRLIVTAMEGCKDGRKLAAALREARDAGKPVLAMKVGVSKAGAQAAATHTGSLSGEDRVFDAVLRDCGAFRASSLEALVDAACVASIGPLPTTRDLLIVTTSGGIGVLAADEAEVCGLTLPGISASARADIRSLAPLADGANPVDTSAGILGDLGIYARIAERALQDRPFGAVLCYLAHIARNPAHWAQLRESLYAVRAAHRAVTFVAVLLASEDVTADLEAHGFSVFTDPSRAVQAIGACVQSATAGRALTGPALSDDRLLQGPVATESQAKVALARTGIAFAPEQVVHDADEAATAALAMRYPVVLKIVSPDIAHKTEAGGVELGIADEASLRAALPAMHTRVRAARPAARIDGFLVARQLKGGVEVLVGTQCDPVFGPVITVGAGGVMAELAQDVAVRLAPVSAKVAREMLSETRAGRLCEGYRGSPPADMDALAQQIAILSEVAWANRDGVEGIDLNPVLALPEGAFALDALIVLRTHTKETLMNDRAINPAHLRQPGHSLPCSRPEMEKRVARFSERQADLGAFPDLKQQQGQRSVSYRLSPGQLGGPAPIDQPHNFHLSVSTLSKGIRPTVHSHPYNEVFMPLDANFRLYWGETLDEWIDLKPFDVVSVPAGVFRTFENMDETTGHMMAIFDHGGDPHTGIVVPPDVFEKFYRNWNPGMVGVQAS